MLVPRNSLSLSAAPLATVGEVSVRYGGAGTGGKRRRGAGTDTTAAMASLICEFWRAAAHPGTVRSRCQPQLAAPKNVECKHQHRRLRGWADGLAKIGRSVQLQGSVAKTYVASTNCLC